MGEDFELIAWFMNEMKKSVTDIRTYDKSFRGKSDSEVVLEVLKLKVDEARKEAWD